MIHFLVGPGTDLHGLDAWDPDADPAWHPSGIGHAVIELQRWLARSGRTTTIGPVVPRDATLVVVHPQPFLYTARSHARLGLRLRRHRVLSIRADTEPQWRRPFRVDREIAPSTTYVERRGGRRTSFLPLLPQRGLLPRDPGRGTRLEVATTKTNPENVPLPFFDPAWRARLRGVGVELVIDAPTVTSGTDQRWHDFTGVDLVVCARRPGQPTLTKPATRLVNAWLADTIPLAAREPAYLEIATDGVDVLFFDDPDEIPDLVARLRDDPALHARLRAGVAAARDRLPSRAALVDEWWRTCTELEGPPSTLRSVRSLAVLTSALTVRRARRLGRLARVGARRLRPRTRSGAASAP